MRLQSIWLCSLVAATYFLSVHAMSSLGPMWGQRYNSSQGRSAYKNSYALCVLEAGTLTAKCSATFSTDNNTNPSSGTFLAISSGAYFSCALVYGTMKPVCWGSQSLAVPAAFQNVSYSTLSSGAFHVCGFRSLDGELDCWGEDIFGETKPPEGIRFTYVASGFDFTCGLTEKGEANCWGWNGVTNDTTVPLPANISFKEIYAGAQHVCGIEKNTAKAFCWGWNDYNQSIPPTDVEFTFIAMGMYHSCGLVSDTGKVVCWGDDAFRQLTEAPRDETFSLIAAGDYYTCGVSLQELQRVKCWGNSVIFTQTDLRASPGLCSSKQCGSQEHELPDAAVGGMQQCPVKGDRICLNCFEQCVKNKTTVSTPTPSFPAPSPRSPAGSSSQAHSRVIAGVFGAVGGLLVISVIVFAYVRYCRRPQRRSGRPQNVQAWTSLANRLVSFTSGELMTATNNYSQDMVIGKGAFGVVYKGVLPNGQALAIKKSQVADDTTMVKELELLSRIHHVNLVNLVGYCASDKLLAFEFMGNGSLHDILFRKPGMHLSWRRRIQIAAQAARGLEYLHFYASPQILHRDVKAANILLDQHLNAHISDFGLSLLEAPANVTHMSYVTVAGTPGYIDPEYVQTMHFSSKSDVYSFGVVLLELLTGRHAVLEAETLATWVSSALSEDVNKDRLGEGDIWKVLDSRLEFDSDRTALDPLQSVVVLALQCTSPSGKNRPSMTRVANLLEEALKRKDYKSYLGGSSSVEEGLSGEKYLLQGLDESVILPR